MVAQRANEPPPADAGAERAERKPAALHIPSLDGLRTVSFLMVFGAHGGSPWPLPIPGGFGVTVFFFLSGYLITTLLRTELAKTGRVNLSKFYLRRALRILPPFYLVLFGALIANQVGLLPGLVEPRAVMAQALHYANYWIIGHTYVGVPPGTGVYWSLAVEEHFYLLFPALFLVLARWRARPAAQAGLLLALCAAVLVWRAFLKIQLGDASHLRTELASDTRCDSILFGCVLAVYGNPALDRSAFTERIWKYVLLPLGVFGLLLSFLIRDQFFREVLRYSLQGLSLVPVFVCAVRYPDWLPMKVLNLRPIAKLGVLSYSLYLMHQVVLEIVQHHPTLGSISLGLRALLTLVISIALAQLMFVLVEKPCARLRRALSA